MTREEIIRMAREVGMHGMLTDVMTTLDELERFASLVAAAEREAIMDEWSDCVQADLEHGVRWLNEQAAKKWQESYPAMAGFAEAIRARGEPVLRDRPCTCHPDDNPPKPCAKRYALSECRHPRKGE